MATSNAQIQKDFKLIIKNGLPQATVETIKGVQWLRCCPLCGSVHQIIGKAADSSPYVPLCQTVPVLFRAELVAWHKLYPDVADHTSLQLVEKTA